MGKSILKYVSIFFGTTLLKVEGYVSLYSMLSYSTQTPSISNMNLFIEIIKFLSLPLLITGLFVYFDWRSAKEKRDLKKYVDNSLEIHQEVTLLFDVVNSRKNRYLFDCIKNQRITPPNKFTSTYEDELFDKLCEKLIFDNKKIEERLKSNEFDTSQSQTTTQ